MNYVELHLGDWAQAVAHLSMLEEAAYLRLLRRYYADERPLPPDLAACQRLAGARTQDEREAVAVVLGEFFTLTDDGYRNKRADEEIAKVYAKKDKAAASAKARWNANASETDANAMRPHSERNATACETHSERNAHQSPDTSNQTRAKKEQSARATRLPQDWQPSPDDLAWARAKRPELDALAEADKFRDYWTAKDRDAAKRDWSATWRNWIRNSHAPPRRGTPNAAPSKQMQGLANILGLTHESNDPSRLVLDLDSSGFGADVRQLPPRLPGC